MVNNIWKLSSTHFVTNINVTFQIYSIKAFDKIIMWFGLNYGLVVWTVCKTTTDLTLPLSALFGNKSHCIYSFDLQMRKLYFLFFVLSETAVYYNVLRFELQVKNLRILHLVLKEWRTRADGERMIEDEFRIECLPNHTSRLGWFTAFKFFLANIPRVS